MDMKLRSDIKEFVVGLRRDIDVEDLAKRIELADKDDISWLFVYILRKLI